MAKARVEVQNDADSTGEAQRMADLNEAEGGDLYRAIDEARSTTGAEVILTRTMPADKAGFCDKIPVSEFELSMVKSKYGAGTYRVRFNGPSGFLPGGGTIKIAPTPEKPQSSRGEFETYLEIMERRDTERKARTDDWLKLALPIVGGIVTAIVSRQSGPDIGNLITALKPAPGPSLTELSTAMVNMKALSGSDKPQESQVDTILKVFEAAQNLMGDKEGGGTTGGSSWLDVIRDLIKAAPDALKPMLEARMAAMQPGKMVATVQPVPSPAIANSPTLGAAPSIVVSQASPVTAPATEGNDMRAIWEPIAKQHLAKVAAWAQKDRAPEVYAEVFVDELPDVSAYLTVDQVLEHLQNPQWFEIICVLEPALSTHRDYCDEFRKAVIEIVKTLKEESEEGTRTVENDPS